MRLVLSKWEEMELAELIVDTNGSGQVSLPINDGACDDEIRIVCDYRLSVFYENPEDSTGWRHVDTYALTIDEIYLDVNGITVDIEVEYDAGRIDTYVSQILNQR